MHDMDRDPDSARGPRVVGYAVWGSSRSPVGRIFLGLGLVMFGLLWTLQALDWRPADELIRWWPLLLVGYGVATLSGWGGVRSVPRGLFFTGLGAVLVLAHLVHISVGFGVVWSLIIMFAGVVLLRRSFVPYHDDASPGTAGAAGADGPLKLYAIMGAAIRRASGQAPTRGELFAVMGGIELDLRKVVPPPGPLVLDVFAVAGGVEVIVPETWRVRSDIVPIAGAVEDRTTRTPEGAAEATLELRGTVVMGGVVVRNTPGADREVVIRRRRYRRGGVEEIHVSPLGVSIKRGPASGTTDPGTGSDAGATTDTGAAGPPSGEPPSRARRIRVTEEDSATPVAVAIVRALVIVAILAVVWLAMHRLPPAIPPAAGTPPAWSSAPLDSTGHR